MQIIKTDIEDLLLIKPKIWKDQRGYFYESFNDTLFKENNLNSNWVQDNESYSTYGVIRGLHFQIPPMSQAKLVRVIKGSILDVVVDLRKNSPSYGQHLSFELNEIDKHQLLIPRGFAHGFAVLSKEAIFSYKCDNYYSPQHDAGIRFDDNDLDIDWMIPKNEQILSEKDQTLPLFHQIKPI